MRALLRRLMWVAMRLLYRVSSSGMDNVPLTGPALLVANHVSYLDAILIACHIRRPIHFVMYWRIYDWAPRLFAKLGAIPIASPRECLSTYERAFSTISKLLREDHLVCIFPEGMLTRNGTLNRFRPGAQMILTETPVPVIPIALKGLWGSFFSRHGSPWFKLPSRWMGHVSIEAGIALSPSVTCQDMEDRVREMLESVA